MSNHRKHAVAATDTRHLGDGLERPRHVVQREATHDQIELAGRKRQRGRVSAHEHDVGAAVVERGTEPNREHLVGQVDDDAGRAVRSGGQVAGQPARPAGDVEDPRARRDGQMPADPLQDRRIAEERARRLEVVRLTAELAPEDLLLSFFLGHRAPRRRWSRSDHAIPGGAAARPLSAGST
jgi:hypothetical protein